jgi:hypothetical protein
MSLFLQPLFILELNTGLNTSLYSNFQINNQAITDCQCLGYFFVSFGKSTGVKIPTFCFN